MVTRRHVTGLLVAPALQSQQPETGSIRDLPLNPAQLKEVMEDGRRAVQQASLLSELPLDGIPPGFVFVAR